MMGNIKYSAIIGSLGQCSDRFLKTGYKFPNEIKNTFEEEVEALAGLGVLDGLDLFFNEKMDSNHVNEVLDKYNFTVGSTFPNLFGEIQWRNGSLAVSDNKIRKEAIDLCKKVLDFDSKLKGDVTLNLWLGQDGFDYPFQEDYTKAWNNLVDSIHEIADYKTEQRITLEAKVREPRNRCFIDTVATALLLIKEIDKDNVGLAIDIGHTFQAQQNIAQNVALADFYGKLWTLHANDNYNLWDDDMIAGSIRTVEYLEMFYYLKKIGYEGFIAVDIYPYRDNTLGCTKETVLNLKKFEELICIIGMDKIKDMIESGDVAKNSKIIRESIYR
ncbi:MAG: sugar phosphate isomerase/epimerase family protein [Candidatus Humimicrobiaceae bacterium]